MINKATLDVQADDKTRGFGSTNPVFTATFTGLQAGDDITAAFTCDALPASAPGTYPINIASLLDPDNRLGNYNLTLGNGTLTVTEVITARTLTVANAYSSPGSEVAVVVNLAAQGDENSLAFSLAFDPALTYVGFTAGTAIAPGSIFNVDVSGAGSGKLGVQATLPNGTTLPDGSQQLVIFTFQVSSTISNQTSLPINFIDQPDVRQVASTTHVLLPANYIGGTVTVYTGFEADANNSGGVSAADYTLVGRIVAGLSTITDPGQFMRVDCAPRSTKGNGSISASDWTQTGRYVVGLDPITQIGGLGGSTQSPAIAGSAQTVKLSGRKGEVSAQGFSGRTLRLVGTNAEVGATVQLPVELVASGDENAVSFSATFDPANLEFLSAASGSGLPSGAQVLLNTTNRSAGQVGVLIGAGPGKVFAAGAHEVLVLTMQVKSAGNGTLGIAFCDSPLSREFVSADAEVLSGDYVSTSILVGGVPNVLKLDASQITDGGTRLFMNGTPDRTYQIMVSTNLSNWTVLATVTASSTGLVEARDPEAKKHPIRFYRSAAQ
ncbi:MAG: hypothetical protein MUF81_20340 [Verrucomicrobia bacterium]|nr:hypothetical protein [Verrucomicrobiota bacterium]